MTKHRLLIAQKPEAMALTATALSDYAILKATTMEHAEKLIHDKHIDMFVVGIHFDDSKAIELIQKIRQSSHHASTPLIVVRTVPSPMAKLLKQTISGVQKVQAISEYLEVEGDPQAEMKIREAVEKRLGQHPAI